MSDLDRATSVCLAYLHHRGKVRELLLLYVADGLKAQNMEGSRATGHAIVQDEDGARPTVSDPTGEQAWRRDGFRTLLEDCEASERRLIGGANRLVGHTMVTRPDQLTQILHAYRGRDDLYNRLIRSAAETFQRALAHTVDANTKDVAGRSASVPNCQSCHRLKLSTGPWEVDPDYIDGAPTDVAGRLTRKLRICRACQRFISSHDRLPSVKELRHRHDDPRNHWPGEGRRGKAA